MRLAKCWLLTFLLLSLLVACAPKTAPAPAPPAAAPAPKAAPAMPAAVTAAPAKAVWAVKWDETLAAAKREGTVAMTSEGGPAVRAALLKVADAAGIRAEILSIKAAELVPKFTIERRAGLYLYDISMTGCAPLTLYLKPAGFLERLDSALILPDVADPDLTKKLWYQGTLPWVDKDHTMLFFALQPRLAIAVNTNLVKSDEIKSWRDVLNPKWKGKLAMSDPTIPGMGQVAVFAMVAIMGEDYVKELAKAEPILYRDERLALDWLSHGKIVAVIAPQLEVLIDLVRAGAPIKGVTPAEGTWTSASTSGLGMLTNAPHPNAAKAFINTLATKEGQTFLAVAGGYHSPRLDVPTSHLPPELIRQEGVKYIDGVSEEATLRRLVTDKIAKDVFGPLVGK